MAPSYILIVVLVAFAVPQPSAAAGGRVAQPSTRPQFFFPRFPCVPGFPRWLLPCYEPQPMDQPTECWSPLMTLVSPCGEYLTNANVSSPPTECCDRYNDVLDDAGICMCHMANGDIGKLLPAPLNFTQLFAIPEACDNPMRLSAFSHCDGKSCMPRLTLIC
jgi:hypothetical protein